MKIWVAPVSLISCSSFPAHFLVLARKDFWNMIDIEFCGQVNLAGICFHGVLDVSSFFCSDFLWFLTLGFVFGLRPGSGVFLFGAFCGVGVSVGAVHDMFLLIDANFSRFFLFLSAPRNPHLQQKARCSWSPLSIPKQKTPRSRNRGARTPPKGALAVGSVHRRSLVSITGWQPSPVLWSNCGISAGSHRKGGSRDSHRWPRM